MADYRDDAVRQSDNGRSSIEDIKLAACGKWRSILQDAGLPADSLDHRGRPCPKCGGKDRFNAAKNVSDTGAVYCRKCFNKDSSIRPGDGIATVAWFLDLSNRDAAKWVARWIGLDDSPHESLDIISAVCRDKRMPVEAFKSFGVAEAIRGRERRLVARVNVYDPNGKVHSYFDLWPGDKGKFKRGEGNSGMFFPGRLPKAGETWIIVEGVKDAAALVGLGYNAAGLPSSKLPPQFAQLFDGVTTIVMHDLDHGGRKGAISSCRSLIGIAESTAVARLPGEIKQSKGDDVRNLLAKPNGDALVREAISRAKPFRPELNNDSLDDRPEIIVSKKEAVVALEVIQALGNLGWDKPSIDSDWRDSDRIYCRGGRLAHVIIGNGIDSNGRSTIRELPHSMVRERITQACMLVDEDENQDSVRPARPPKWLTDAVHDRGEYGGYIRPLVGIVDTPTIRDDGSILQTPGYDRATGLMYHPITTFPVIPESPTREDARHSFSLLLEPLSDFPFLNDSDRSAFVAMLLSMVGRTAIKGNVPLFAVTGNVRGSGKSLLVDIASIISYGHPAGRTVFARNGAELHKAITAFAIAAEPIVLFDNVDVELGGGALDAAVTSAVWNGRILGASRTTGNLPMRIVWVATGNNLRFGSDLSRRVLPIRLQSPMERPEDRTDFRYPDLLAWINRNRSELVLAALMILRAFFVAGRPEKTHSQWGSFESWTRTIRGAIVWAGGADPLVTRDFAIAADESSELLGKLINGLQAADPEDRGLTVKEIEECLSHDSSSNQQALSEAVNEICGSQFDGKKFGKKLAQFTGRIWQGRCITSKPAGGGVRRWRVETVKSGLSGSDGSVGTTSNSDVMLSYNNTCDGGSASNDPPNP